MSDQRTVTRVTFEGHTGIGSLSRVVQIESENFAQMRHKVTLRESHSGLSSQQSARCHSVVSESLRRRIGDQIRIAVVDRCV